jgi:hypothetical protein
MIPHPVAKGIVDLLETVQVHEEEGEALALPLGQLDGLIQTVREELSIG